MTEFITNHRALAAAISVIVKRERAGGLFCTWPRLAFLVAEELHLSDKAKNIELLTEQLPVLCLNYLLNTKVGLSVDLRGKSLSIVEMNHAEAHTE